MTLNPNAFISVHCNASDNAQANGCEVVYRDWVDRVIAVELQAKLISTLGLRDRGLKIDLEDLKRSLAVLSTPNIPSVIVEPGFLTNDKDRSVLLQTNLVARALVDGVEAWQIKYSVL
jgi:N-acetylmuramoyl-L-alanine amidase